MSGKVTLKDVAREAGVSLATASYALNDKKEVGEGTRVHVQEVARRLGYQANLAARAMKTGRTGCIGLVIPNITNPLFARLAQSVTAAAENHDAAVFLVDTEGSKDAETEAINQLLRRGADGLIWFPVNDESGIQPGQFDAPVVVLDRQAPGFDVVQAEYFEGGRLVGEHLRLQGHSRIGLLDGPRDVLNSRQRSEGVRAGLGDAADIRWAIEHPYVSDLTEAAWDLLRRRDVTAIACGNDLIALAALAAMRDLGMEAGKEVALVGYDDIDLCRLVWPRLSSVRLPIADMGTAAVERLMARLRKRDLAVQRIVLGVSLSVRESSSWPAAT